MSFSQDTSILFVGKNIHNKLDSILSIILSKDKTDIDVVKSTFVYDSDISDTRKSPYRAGSNDVSLINAVIEHPLLSKLQNAPFIRVAFDSESNEIFPVDPANTNNSAQTVQIILTHEMYLSNTAMGAPLTFRHPEYKRIKEHPTLQEALLASSRKNEQKEETFDSSTTQAYKGNYVSHGFISIITDESNPWHAGEILKQIDDILQQESNVRACFSLSTPFVSAKYLDKEQSPDNPLIKHQKNGEVREAIACSRMLIFSFATISFTLERPSTENILALLPSDITFYERRVSAIRHVMEATLEKLTNAHPTSYKVHAKDSRRLYAELKSILGSNACVTVTPNRTFINFLSDDQSLRTSALWKINEHSKAYEYVEEQMLDYSIAKMVVASLVVLHRHKERKYTSTGSSLGKNTSTAEKIFADLNAALIEQNINLCEEGMEDINSFFPLYANSADSQPVEATTAPQRSTSQHQESKEEAKANLNSALPSSPSVTNNNCNTPIHDSTINEENNNNKKNIKNINKDYENSTINNNNKNNQTSKDKPFKFEIKTNNSLRKQPKESQMQESPTMNTMLQEYKISNINSIIPYQAKIQTSKEEGSASNSNSTTIQQSGFGYAIFNEEDDEDEEYAQEIPVTRGRQKRKREESLRSDFTSTTKEMVVEEHDMHTNVTNSMQMVEEDEILSPAFMETNVIFNSLMYDTDVEPTPAQVDEAVKHVMSYHKDYWRKQITWNELLKLSDHIQIERYYNQSNKERIHREDIVEDEVYIEDSTIKKFIKQAFNLPRDLQSEYKEEQNYSSSSSSSSSY